MTTISKYGSVLVIGLAMLTHVGFAQKTAVQSNNYKFTLVKTLETTPVENQGRTGTCWSFASMSLLESEMLRLGREAVDLSEMYLVRRAYEAKADKYVRMHGDIGFDQGGELHDVMMIAPNYGVVPESVYPGMKYSPENDGHHHGELSNILTEMVNVVIKGHNGDLTPVWDEAYDDILDRYLGAVPASFTYEGQSYSPSTFFEKIVGIQTKDYVQLTSFKHKPFYKPYVIQLPDNWAWGEAYNVPLEDFTKILRNSLMQGYTVGWASDVSDPGFAHGKGLAIVPEKRWDQMSSKEKDQVFKKPVKQRDITIEMRQQGYDNYDITDDHAMHITGLAEDQNGARYYLVKNSWGTGNPYDGFLYVSEAYVQLKSTAIMVHKEVIPKEIKSKMKGLTEFSWE